MLNCGDAVLFVISSICLLPDTVGRVDGKELDFGFNLTTALSPSPSQNNIDEYVLQCGLLSATFAHYL